MKEICNGCLNYLHCPIHRKLALPSCRYFSSVMEVAQLAYEPDDYDGKDIGSATVEEMRLQNGDY